MPDHDEQNNPTTADCLAIHNWQVRYDAAVNQTQLPRDIGLYRAYKIAPESRPQVSYDLLRQLRDSEEVICSVSFPALRLVPGDLPAAMVLSHIAYMLHQKSGNGYFLLGPRSKLKDGNEYAVIINRPTLSARLTLSPWQVKRAIGTLVSQKIIDRRIGTRGIPVAVMLPRGGVLFKRAFALAVTGRLIRACDHHLTDALILARISYWMGLSKRTNCNRCQYFSPEGRPWLLKSLRNMAAELSLTFSQTRDAIDRLLARRMIEQQAHAAVSRVKPTRAYSLVPEVVAAAIRQQPLVRWTMVSRTVGTEPD